MHSFKSKPTNKSVMSPIKFILLASLVLNTFRKYLDWIKLQFSQYNGPSCWISICFEELPIASPFQCPLPLPDSWLKSMRPSLSRAMLRKRINRRILSHILDLSLEIDSRYKPYYNNFASSKIRNWTELNMDSNHNIYNHFSFSCCYVNISRSLLGRPTWWKPPQWKLWK